MIGLLDAIFDRTVVAGYTNVGYRLRRRMCHADDLARMRGETVLVTGATSGLGLAAAEGFARLGASSRMDARPRPLEDEATLDFIGVGEFDQVVRALRASPLVVAMPSRWKPALAAHPTAWTSVSRLLGIASTNS